MDIGTIQQNLKKINVLGSVLYIAAHPDDENTRLLAYLAQEKHYRTGYLSLTRGDGGQNLIGTEQGELLGLTRTQELLAARRIDGAEQFFSRVNDFGFSKTPEETLKFWDKDKVLGDMVWVIRKFRPDVMICRFPTTGEGGHGNHTASAILAQEAFSAAADPNKYPEQLKHLQVWQAKRLLWNTFNFGTTNTTAPDQFKINVGAFNPLLGKSYGEIAAESRSSHKTQGFGSAKQRGDAFEYFKTILGDAPKTDLMDGVNTTWSRVPRGEASTSEINAISKNFNSDAPQASVPALVALLDKVDLTIGTDKALQTVRLTATAAADYEYWHRQKTAELKDLIAQCAGLWFEAYTADQFYALGDSVTVRAQLIKQSNIPVAFNKVSAVVTANAPSAELPENELQTVTFKIKAEKITQPYWMESPHGIGSYKINDDMKVGNPENPDAPEVTYTFTINGKQISYLRKVVFKYTDPARGEVYQPLVIAPAVTADIQNKAYIFNSLQPQTVQVKLKSFINTNGSISLKPVDGWKISPAKIEFSGKKKGDEWSVTFSVTPASGKTSTAVLEAVTTANGQQNALGLHSIRYQHIPTITFFPPAQAKLVNLDIKTGGKKIGYIAGAGDLVPEALEQVGYEVHQLSENEVLNTNLASYDAIVVGVRAYNVNERLAVEQPRLLDYVKNGGNLVVQYNNNNGLVAQQLGPYPFRVVNERVTNEDAPVTIFDNTNPVLNYPNKITADDFKGWVQERSVYMVNNIDPMYKAPLKMNDPGQAPQNGALIVANYGKGRYIYTSLVFFRELPAGVPGAFRLFINLLSNPK